MYPCIHFSTYMLRSTLLSLTGRNFRLIIKLNCLQHHIQYTTIFYVVITYIYHLLHTLHNLCLNLLDTTTFSLNPLNFAWESSNGILIAQTAQWASSLVVKSVLQGTLPNGHRCPSRNVPWRTPVTPRERSGNVPGTFRERSGNVPRTFPEGHLWPLGNVPGTFLERSLKDTFDHQGTFRERSWNVPGTFPEWHFWPPGNVPGTFPEGHLWPPGNVPGTFPGWSLPTGRWQLDTRIIYSDMRLPERGDVVVEKLVNLVLSTVHVVKTVQLLITPPIEWSTYPPHFDTFHDTFRFLWYVVSSKHSRFILLPELNFTYVSN